MKFLYIVNFFYIFILPNKNLLAQSYPNYNEIIDQKNKSSLKKAIGLSAFSTAGIGAIGAFLTTKIHPLEIPMQNLPTGFLEPNHIAEELENFDELEEEVIEEIGELSKISISSVGIIFFISAYYPAFKSMYHHFSHNTPFGNSNSLIYHYFIRDVQGKEVCVGSKEFFYPNLEDINFSKISWKELNDACKGQLNNGETYFFYLNDSDGNTIIDGKKIIPIF